jgi:energy-coupling factor transporter ATP-binding protein EcfA2
MSMLANSEITSNVLFGLEAIQTPPEKPKQLHLTSQNQSAMQQIDHFLCNMNVHNSKQSVSIKHEYYYFVNCCTIVIQLDNVIVKISH